MSKGRGQSVQLRPSPLLSSGVNRPQGLTIRDIREGLCHSPELLLAFLIRIEVEKFAWLLPVTNKITFCRSPLVGVDLLILTDIDRRLDNSLPRSRWLRNWRRECEPTRHNDGDVENVKCHSWVDCDIEEVEEEKQTPLTTKKLQDLCYNDEMDHGSLKFICGESIIAAFLTLSCSGNRRTEGHGPGEMEVASWSRSWLDLTCTRDIWCSIPLLEEWICQKDQETGATTAACANTIPHYRFYLGVFGPLANRCKFWLASQGECSCTWGAYFFARFMKSVFMKHYWQSRQPARGRRECPQVSGKQPRGKAEITERLSGDINPHYVVPESFR